MACITLRSTHPKIIRLCRRLSKLQATKSMFAFMAGTARTGSSATSRQPSDSNTCIRNRSSSPLASGDSRDFKSTEEYPRLRLSLKQLVEPPCHVFGDLGQVLHRGERAIKEVLGRFATFCGCEASGLWLPI